MNYKVTSKLESASCKSIIHTLLKWSTGLLRDMNFSDPWCISCISFFSWPKRVPWLTVTSIFQSREWSPLPRCDPVKCLISRSSRGNLSITEEIERESPVSLVSNKDHLRIWSERNLQIRKEDFQKNRDKGILHLESWLAYGFPSLLTLVFCARFDVNDVTSRVINWKEIQGSQGKTRHTFFISRVTTEMETERRQVIPCRGEKTVERGIEDLSLPFHFCQSKGILCLVLQISICKRPSLHLNWKQKRSKSGTHCKSDNHIRQELFNRRLRKIEAVFFSNDSWWFYKDAARASIVPNSSPLSSKSFLFMMFSRIWLVSFEEVVFHLLIDNSVVVVWFEFLSKITFERITCQPLW